jgi:hypothetical protein
MNHTRKKPDSWREALPLARAVYNRHPSGCCAHILLDDGNTSDLDAQLCLDGARERQHPDCIALCETLAAMSVTQRTKLHDHYDDFAGTLAERFPSLMTGTLSCLPGSITVGTVFTNPVTGEAFTVVSLTPKGGL